MSGLLYADRRSLYARTTSICPRIGVSPDNDNVLNGVESLRDVFPTMHHLWAWQLAIGTPDDTEMR